MKSWKAFAGGILFLMLAVGCLGSCHHYNLSSVSPDPHNAGYGIGFMASGLASFILFMSSADKL